MKSLAYANSYSYATANERGWQEVTIDYRQTLFERIFKKPGKSFTFVARQHSNVWFHKDSLADAYGWITVIFQVIRLCEFHGRDKS